MIYTEKEQICTLSGLFFNVNPGSGLCHQPQIPSVLIQVVQ